MQKEIWLPIEGYEGYYEISNQGKIKSLPNKNRYRPNQNNGLMTVCPNTWGYPQVTLSLQGKQKAFSVHRLVAKTFIPNPESLPCINHKNGIKTDNRFFNLEWVTYSENELHSVRVLGKNLKGIKKSFKGGVNPRAKKIKCHETNEIYPSVAAAAIRLEVHRANINKQLNGDIKQIGGYTFSFV